MQCPCCSVELNEKMLNDVQVDECHTCKGMWLEDDELRKAKDAADKDLNWMDFEIFKHADQFKTEPRKLPCPKCRKTLVAINYGDTGVQINYCPDCKGTWLDKDEFKEIIAALNDELISKTFHEYIKTSIEEAAEIFTGTEGCFSEWKDLTTVLRMMNYRIFAENPNLRDQLIAMQQASPFQ
ncbi:MAG: hypothetical protein FVQ79_00820 [Planctomycetes bacterium]|nr:hypothetical protein [Planctomycetota bacterium]